MAGTVRLEVDGPIATITNDNPDKHNAFDDDMDQQLFAVVAELCERGWDLSRTEIAALVSTDGAVWARAAEGLDPRLQKASLKNEARVS